tara:strand:+ start:115 stop:537 length:423 start_codon:yes stop_codon:yes gene_type:complete
MKNRFNSNEEEKNRIKMLHRMQVINEQNISSPTGNPNSNVPGVTKEDSSDNTGYCDAPDGYRKTPTNWFERNDKIQGTQFYVMLRKSPTGKCDLLLKWEDGMTPINLGRYYLGTRSWPLLGEFEKLFLALSANPQDYWKK